MPKFLAGCHYSEEEISRHLKKYLGDWPVQMNGNKFATGQILGKPSRSCEGADFSWLSSKVSQTLGLIHRKCPFNSLVFLRQYLGSSFWM
jgi:hypothetical protein